MKYIKMSQLARSSYILSYHNYDCNLYISNTVPIAEKHARKIGVPCSRCHSPKEFARLREARTPA